MELPISEAAHPAWTHGSAPLRPPLRFPGLQHCIDPMSEKPEFHELHLVIFAKNRTFIVNNLMSGPHQHLILCFLKETWSFGANNPDGITIDNQATGASKPLEAEACARYCQQQKQTNII